MKFIDLNAQQTEIRSSLDRRIAEVLTHGAYIMGPEVRELEEKLASYVSTNHCVSCSSGTDALLMALMAYDVGPGDAVFTTPFTFVATAEVIALLGATPVFVDIEEQTFNLDPTKLSQAIIDLAANHPELQARGIMTVDLFGQPADYEQINRIAKEHSLFVIEDAAQSFGAEYEGKKSGNLADLAATSFFPAKPLGCYGDGGAVFCNDPALAEKLHSIRVHGQGDDKYENIRIGINGRLDTLQAAVLLTKLEIFDREIELRNKVAAHYSDGLSAAVVVPQVAANRTSVWAQYSVLSDSRDELLDKLSANGIPTAIYYPLPLHLQPAFDHLGYAIGDFPVSERIASHIFSIPMHPYLSEEDQQKVISAIVN